VEQTRYCGLGFGTSDKIPPLRTIGYVLSAFNVRAHFLPLAQLQVVFPLAVIEAVNGVSLAAAREVAETVQTLVRLGLSSGNGPATKYDDVVFTESTAVPNDQLASFVASTLAANEQLSERFGKQANRRLATANAYVAAHLLVHDTQTALLPLSGVLEPAVCTGQRIVSIGAQSERPFYAARMACRRAVDRPINMVANTGQLFTRHVLPPYITCKQGEPDVFELESLLGDTIQHPVASVQRDLIFLQDRLIRKNSQETL
jgi:hypothetical protein